MKKSQVSVEYILIVGIALLILLALFYYAINRSNITIKLSQAEDAVMTLAKTADVVYALGPGTKDYVYITIPYGVKGFFINGTTIRLKLDIFGNVSDVYVHTKGTVTGYIESTQGTKYVSVEALSSGVVVIGEYSDLTPPQVIWTDPSGTIGYNDVTLKANTNENADCKFDSNDINYSLMGYDFVGSALTHSYHIGILSSGNHVYYVRCSDTVGNTMDDSAVINFTINVTVNETVNVTVNETFEQNDPIISLINPANNTIDDDGIILFQYNVTDESSISFCELILNRVMDKINSSVVRDETQNFTKIMDYGNYSWNVNCTDVHGNEGESDSWNIFVNYTQDTDSPIVNLIRPVDNSVKSTNYIEFEYNVTDATSNISDCTLKINGTLEGGDPFSQTLVDDSIQENETQIFQVVLNNGNYTWNVFCVDNSYYANTGYSEYWDLIVNASYEVGISLKDLGLDNAWYFKTDGNGLTTKDTEMSPFGDITEDLLDDDITTPPSTYVMRTKGDKYEGYVAKVDKDSSSYTKIVLYGRVRIIDVSPFRLRVYPYNLDGNTPNTAEYADFSIEDSILNEKVKWVELDVTNIARREDGFGWIRMRITALNNTEQDNKRFQFSELHFKVG